MSDRSFYRNYYREIDVLHGLQSAPEERDWLLTTPKGDVKQSDIVLYLGCNVLRTTHLVRTVMDLFKLLDVDFTAVGGAAYCCGIQHHQRGDEASARSVAATTAANFRKFGPEQVVMWCPSCIFFYDDIIDMREDFTFQHVTEFLVQNRHKLEFRPQPETTVALHYHTGRPQSDAEAQSALTLLRQLPGVTVRDIGADPRFGRHCTPAVRQQMGPDAWDAMCGDWAQRAADAGADTYHAVPRLPAPYVRPGSRLPPQGRALPDAGRPRPRHRIRRPVQKAHPDGQPQRGAGRNRPLRRSQRHPPARSPSRHSPHLPAPVDGCYVRPSRPRASCGETTRRL